MNENNRNVGTLERVVRVVAGGLVAGVGLVFLAQGISSLWLAGVEGAGVVLGLDFVFTGLTGYCPLYRRLGRSTAHSPRIRHTSPS